MEQVDPNDCRLLEVVAYGISSQKDMERMIAGVQHRFRTIGITASVPHDAPARLEGDRAVFQVSTWRDISFKLAQHILTDFGYACRELVDKVCVATLPSLWPVRAKLAGRVDLDAVYRISAFESDQHCLRFAEHVLSGGKRAGYANVLNMIVRGGKKFLDGHYAILLAEGFMSDKKLSDIEEEVPQARIYARRALSRVGQPYGGVLEQIVGSG
ncbi:MAG: hypothetical protein PHW63_06755 [Alphaproteobacteria bacterium]|nr:hypothetical protein [Alphaproteobacteria bacterium]